MGRRVATIKVEYDRGLPIDEERWEEILLGEAGWFDRPVHVEVVEDRAAP